MKRLTLHRIASSLLLPSCAQGCLANSSPIEVSQQVWLSSKEGLATLWQKELEISAIDN
jgi:hypothetical protein